MSTIRSRLSRLRSLMMERGIDAYVVPSADNHQSEYVGAYFKEREFITGFTGSAGTAVVTATDAGLWTDGRYFIQAERELDGSGIRLFRMGVSGVPTVLEYLDDALPSGGALGFCGMRVSLQEGRRWNQRLKARDILLKYREDLIGSIWTDRPRLAREPVFELGERYSGESRASKLARVREVMKAEGANRHVLASLDDVAWLLNIRGSDVLYSPLVLCYAVISFDSVDLFIDESRVPQSVQASLSRDGVVFHPYDRIYPWVGTLGEGDVVWIDPDKLNYALYKGLPETVQTLERENPTILFKAVKNPVELENIRNAHVKDGVAHTKFMYWLKTQLGKTTITELSASKKLESLRAQQEGYLWPSFAPICAFGEHAAMMHYSATPETDVELAPGSLFLTDTGGNYYEGSTDVTRTVALGEIDVGLKRHFTAVLRGMLNLSRARFLYGCRGYNLDILAREPMWSMEIDYKCGTGHGVGYLLNIHEGPCGFRWYSVPSKHETHVLEAGMVITDEPGIYIEGSHGIRIENELIVRRGTENEFGQFMYMEHVTFVPIDLDAVWVEDLSRDERESLNTYHRMVYEILEPHMDDDEREWLRRYTRAV